MKLNRKQLRKMILSEVNTLKEAASYTESDYEQLMEVIETAVGSLKPRYTQEDAQEDGQGGVTIGFTPADASSGEPGVVINIKYDT